MSKLKFFKSVLPDEVLKEVDESFKGFESGELYEQQLECEYNYLNHLSDLIEELNYDLPYGIAQEVNDCYPPLLFSRTGLKNYFSSVEHHYRELKEVYTQFYKLKEQMDNLIPKLPRKALKIIKSQFSALELSTEGFEYFERYVNTIEYLTGI